MFFRAPDLLPIEEEIYLLSFDIPVTFFLDWLEKMDRKRTCQVLAQGYAKRRKNGSTCFEFRVVLFIILAMNAKGFQC